MIYSKLITLSVWCLFLLNCSCQEKTGVSQPHGMVEISNIIRENFCGRDESHEIHIGNNKSMQSADAFKLYKRNFFFVTSKRAISIAGIRYFLKKKHIKEPDSLYNIFCADTIALKVPYELSICKNQKFIICAEDDSVASEINSYISLSNPINIDANNQLFYYEMGRNKFSLMAGVIIMKKNGYKDNSFSTGSMLWIN